MNREQVYTLGFVGGWTALYIVGLVVWEFVALAKWGGSGTITTSLRALARSQPWLTHGLGVLAGMLVGWTAGHISDYGDECRKANDDAASGKVDPH